MHGKAQSSSHVAAGKSKQLTWELQDRFEHCDHLFGAFPCSHSQRLTAAFISSTLLHGPCRWDRCLELCLRVHCDVASLQVLMALRAVPHATLCYAHSQEAAIVAGKLDNSRPSTTAASSLLLVYNGLVLCVYTTHGSVTIGKQ